MSPQSTIPGGIVTQSITRLCRISKTRFAVALFLAISLGLMVHGAVAQAESTPGTKPFAVYFAGDPACVLPGQHAMFPLVTKNTGTTPLTFNITVLAINQPDMTFGYGLILAHGTDHLTPSDRGPHWVFTLAPGQTMAKHLVTLVQRQMAEYGGPEPYVVTEQVLVSPGPLVTPTYGLYLSSMPVYCGDPVLIGGGMK